jgi:protocatechuate 4,5-dioxygenase alpha chain
MHVNARAAATTIMAAKRKDRPMTAIVETLTARPHRRTIPGTSLFDGDAAARGYALNAMCYSFNDEANREAFRADEEGYCQRFGLTPQQRAAVASRNVLAMIDAGGNIYYLAKLAGIFGLSVQDLGAQQTGVTVEEFRHKLQAEGEL